MDIDRSTTRYSTSSSLSLTTQRNDLESSEAETTTLNDRPNEDNSSLPMAACKIDDESSNSSDANNDSDKSENSVDSSNDEEDVPITAIVKTIGLYNKLPTVWYKPVEMHDRAVICINSNMDTEVEARLHYLIDMRLRYEYCRLLMNDLSTTTPEDASDDDIESFIRLISPTSLSSSANDVRFFSVNIWSKRSSTVLHETDKNGNIRRTHEFWHVSSEITLGRREQCTTRQFRHLVRAIIRTLVNDMDFLHLDGVEFFRSYEDIVRRLRENKTNDSWTCHKVTEDNDIDIRFDDTTNEILLRYQKTNETRIPPRIMFQL